MDDEQLASIMECLSRIEFYAKKLCQGRPPLDVMPMISATRAYVVDYRERKHLFLYSANTLILSLEDLGQITVAQNTWTNIGFAEGLRVFAVGQTANVPILVRATDEVIP